MGRYECLDAGSSREISNLISLYFCLFCIFNRFGLYGDSSVSILMVRPGTEFNCGGGHGNEKVLTQSPIQEVVELASQRSVKEDVLDTGDGPISGYQNWVAGDMDQGHASIYDLAKAWIESPRRKAFRQDKKIRNLSVSVNFFAPVLKKFTPQDLRLDQAYGDFLIRIENLLNEKKLAISTTDSYIGTLTSKILQYANVDTAITAELKENIQAMRKRLKLSKPVNKSISDDDVVQLIGKLDQYCLNPEEAPNLCLIANPKSNVKSARTNHHLLLAVRSYTWLCLCTAGRAEEIRRIRISDINQNWVKREITKGRIYADSLTSNMRDWAWQRIEPHLDYIRENHPEAEFIFSENDNVMGKGTISPKTLRELVKGSMIDAGLEPTSPSGCYYRLHDIRKTIARWISENGGSIEYTTALLSHSSPAITFKAYFGDEHKQSLAHSGQEMAMDRLAELLQIRESTNLEIEQLTDLFQNIDFIEYLGDGTYSIPESTLIGGPGFTTDYGFHENDLHDRGLIKVRAPGLEPGTS